MNARPRVVTWNIATLDGRIAISSSIPSWLDERWAPVTRAGFETVDVMALHETNVHLEGSNSFVGRDAGPADLAPTRPSVDVFEDFLPDAVLRRVERWMAVIDSRGRVPWTMTESEGVHVIVLVSRSTPAAYLRFLRDREVPYLLSGEEGVDLLVALQRLRSTLGAETIVSDAGGLLNGALLNRGLVDEIDLQILPVVAGVPNAPSIFEGYGSGEVSRPLRLKLIHQETRSDGTIFLRFTPDVDLS